MGARPGFTKSVGERVRVSQGIVGDSHATVLDSEEMFSSQKQLRTVMEDQE